MKSEVATRYTEEVFSRLWRIHAQRQVYLYRHITASGDRFADAPRSSLRIENNAQMRLTINGLFFATVPVGEISEEFDVHSPRGTSILIKSAACLLTE